MKRRRSPTQHFKNGAVISIVSELAQLQHDLQGWKKIVTHLKCTTCKTFEAKGEGTIVQVGLMG